MITVALGLAAAVVFALGDFAAARVVRRAPVLSVLLWILVVGVVVALPAALVTDGLPSGSSEWRAAGLAAISGVLYVIAFSSLLKGLERGSLSIVAPLTALEGAFAAAISFGLGERLSPATAAALAAAVAGAVLAASERGRRTAAGAPWALLAACVFSVTFLLYARADAIAPVSAVAVSRLAALAIVLPLLLVLGGELLPRPGLRRLAPLPGLGEAFGLILSATALTSGSVAVASVMIAQFATFAVILGLVLFHERPAAHQLVGVALTIAAVTALALV